MTVWDRGSHGLFQRPRKHTRAEDGSCAAWPCCRLQGLRKPRFFPSRAYPSAWIASAPSLLLKTFNTWPRAEPAGFPPTQCAVVTFIWALHLPLACHHCSGGCRERLPGPVCTQHPGTPLPAASPWALGWECCLTGCHTGPRAVAWSPGPQTSKLAPS